MSDQETILRDALKELQDRVRVLEGHYPLTIHMGISLNRSSAVRGTDMSLHEICLKEAEWLEEGRIVVRARCQKYEDDERMLGRITAAIWGVIREELASGSPKTALS